jgi:MFS family permease
LAVTLAAFAIILAFFGFAPSLPIMLVLIASESFLSPIYLAPRNVFISRILTKSKRTASLGIITMVKLTTNATGSFFTGFMADRDLFWLAFVVAGSLKVVFVAGMLYTFLTLDRRLEEEHRERIGASG